MTPTEQAIARLRRDAHVHQDRCYGSYEPCGEHHAHDMTCGSRRLWCRQDDRPDLVLVVAELDRLKTEVLRLTAVPLPTEAVGPPADYTFDNERG